MSEASFEQGSYEFDNARVLMPGDPVVVVQVHVGFADPLLSNIAEHPSILDAVFTGYHYASISDEIEFGLSDGMEVPHLELALPSNLTGWSGDCAVEVLGPECYWTTPEIYDAGIADAAAAIDFQIPDSLPPGLL